MATDEGQEEDSDPLPDLFSSTEQDALVEGVVLADCLSAEQKDHCINLLGQFSELFSTVPGTTSWCEHTIDTGDSLPVKSKIYKQPDHVRDCIKQEVQKMLELGVVEHSESPWASPVVLVPKPHSKDGKKEMRFSVDYRGLNQVTKTDAHPIPRADELIDTLASAKYLSTFDLTAGYWQIKLSEDAKPKTAFSTIGGHYQFTVMPFGLKNAPATFQRLVNTVLQGLEAFSAAYLDDIAVFGCSWDDHLVHLWKVLEALQKAGLIIKASKCQIGQGKVVYLGHLVGGEQIAPLQGKIQTIIDWVPPTTQTQGRAFLGLSGYYRTFIKNYGSIAAPLNDLTSKKMPKKVLWTANCQKAFEELKQAMCSAPVLKSPCYSKKFYVQTDASELGERQGLETFPLEDRSVTPWRVVQKWFPPKDSQQALLAANRAGDDSVDPREISLALLVQRGGRLPPQHAPPGKQSRRRQDQRYRVAVVVFATMLQFCRLPARSAVDSLAEGEERDAEELG
ncbi:hypothetical protein NDU88_005031 [Pleurodeles waltl]|uniref:ribonuclease H n=1 Tax=Pleurodeles waltl TaxID=8319 RepID=A0AAV7PHE8_PLEWA|nr:hypothetical protein NDU88_005031 [Pleurodeles waltl]